MTLVFLERTLSQLFSKANKVVSALWLQTKAFLQVWFREDELRGQTYNMVWQLLQWIEQQ